MLKSLNAANLRHKMRRVRENIRGFFWVSLLGTVTLYIDFVLGRTPP